MSNHNADPDFADAARIEAAEAELTRAVVSAAITAGRAPRGFVRELGGGIAAYIRPDSPMNKLIGAGLAAPIAELEELEAQLSARNEPARIELATVAAPAVSASLRARGYQLLGRENVLVRRLLTPLEVATPNVRVERASENTALTWKQTTITAAADSDETGQPVDEHSYEAIAEAIEDFVQAPGFDRYLAFIGDAPAGAASMRIHERIALLSGSATLRAHRLRGAQTALIAARLTEARARGAELAVVTVAPGSRSETNMLKRGFSLAHAREIWTRARATLRTTPETAWVDREIFGPEV